MTTPIRRRIAAVLTAAAVLLAVAACDSETPDKSAQNTGQQQTEQAFAQQQAAVPYPADALKDSLERRNIKERLLRYNNPSKISYIYLLTETGGIYAYFTIKGKVTSNSSQMTTDNLIVTKCHNGNGCNESVVAAPGDDGSYGPNEAGVFFFTTDGVMITWSGLYLLADAPLKINPANITLNYVDGSKPSTTGTK